MQAPGLPRAAASAGDFSRFATPQQSALAARIHQKNPIPEHPWKPSPFKNNNPFLSQQQQRLTGQNTGFIAPSNSQTISPPNSFDGYFGNMTNVNAQRPESQTSRSEVSTGLPGSKSDGFLLRAMADQYGNHETQSQHSDASIQQQLSASNGSIQGSIHGSIQQDTLQLYQQEQAVPSHGPLNFDPVSEHVQRQRSAWLNQLTGANGRPSVQDILHPENVPFIETARLAEPTTNHGVICIGNVSYPRC
ncbi:hypothetical protein F5Y04DRAFT_248554 [Hypomontagnella monticulosa]|nr:hypothetical protein F5Y04DRAFT_248554 [Hypomontagnella monticulosa]